MAGRFFTSEDLDSMPRLCKILEFYADLEIVERMSRGVQELVIYVAYIVENTIKIAPKELDSYIILADMRDFSLRNFKRSDFQQITPIMNDFYPELLYRLIVVNSNFIFKGVWSVIKLMIHPLTVQKIQIQGSSVKEIHDKLSEYVDDDEIPAVFGGKKEIEL